MARLHLFVAAALLVACTGGPSDPREEPFPGQREEALRTEECPARISIEVDEVDIPNDDRLVEDLTRELRAKGSLDPTSEAVARLDEIRPWLGGARSASLSLLANATEACTYGTVDARSNRPSEHRVRIVRTRPENGGESAIVLRMNSTLGSPDALLWLDVPLESASARSLVVDTRRTPALFAQTNASTIALGTFTATARVVE